MDSYLDATAGSWNFNGKAYYPDISTVNQRNGDDLSSATRQMTIDSPISPEPFDTLPDVTLHISDDQDIHMVRVFLQKQPSR